MNRQSKTAAHRIRSVQEPISRMVGPVTGTGKRPVGRPRKTPVLIHGVREIEFDVFVAGFRMRNRGIENPYRRDHEKHAFWAGGLIYGEKWKGAKDQEKVAFGMWLRSALRQRLMDRVSS